eukprot:c6503_g1_i3.p1 GENE.c6503_g1_i3~~c6503_g1_i3.p1  ORF type:complete len:186 (+),score=34.00 c6503_g1_i3:540-1097(+)
MPFLLTLPRGFSQAISLFNDLEVTQQRAIAESTLLKLFGQKSESKGSQAENDLQEALSFVFRSAETTQASPEQVLEDLQVFTPLSEPSAILLSKFWANRNKYKQPAEGATTSATEQGALLGIDWVLGVSLSSSNCDRLQQPYVAISINVAGRDGQIEAHKLELTITEYLKFKAQLEDVAAALDRS